MCLAIPAQVMTINGLEAEVDLSGVRRTISVLMTPELRVGEYVLIHTGFSISVLDEEEAQETLKIFRELDAITAKMAEESGYEVR
jgi:hydrogenase expression/formation protein HypC